MAKKSTKKKTETPIPIPFTLDEDVKPEEILDVPPPVSEPDDFKVKCQVTSIGTRFWKGTVFVALASVDGQNLLDLLREDQEVILHYFKNPAVEPPV